MTINPNSQHQATHCDDLSFRAQPTENSYLFIHLPSWCKWILISLFCVVYTVPICFIWHNRKTQEMTPRSPYMTMLALGYLLFDSAGNTYLFSVRPASARSTQVCYLGVVITVICQFGFMAMCFLRMYRIYSVFSAYENYLKWNKKNLLSDGAFNHDL